MARGSCVTSGFVERVERVITAFPEKSTREIAEYVGCSTTTINRIKMGHYDSLFVSKEHRSDDMWRVADDTEEEPSDAREILAEVKRANALLMVIATTMVNAWLRGDETEQVARDVLRRIKGGEES